MNRRAINSLTPKGGIAMLTASELAQNVRPIESDRLVGDKIQPGHPLLGLIWINPNRVSGAPCFYGTRVPIKILFDSLSAGETLDDFLDGFEGVSREQVIAVIKLAGAICSMTWDGCENSIRPQRRPPISALPAWSRDQNDPRDAMGTA